MILPYPPSTNHYWKRNRNGSVRVGEAGIAFRAAVGWICRQERVIRLLGRLSIRITVCPPDKRRRDLDNTLKALLDALQHGGIYEDDSQIDRIEIERKEVIKGGRVGVTIRQI